MEKWVLGIGTTAQSGVVLPLVREQGCKVHHLLQSSHGR